MKQIERKTKKMLQTEAQRGEPLEELLRRLFVDDNLSLDEIQQELSITRPHLLSWLRKAGIYSRKLRVMETEKKGFRTK